MKCPKCGSGFYTKFQSYQYYDCNGEPCGTESCCNETQYAWCVKCDKKMLLSRIMKEGETNERKLDKKSRRKHTR